MQLIAPSSWMANQASKSAAVRTWPITVIPNPLDVGWWGARTRDQAREHLGLEGRCVLLFGALGGDKDRRKGADLLYGALNRLSLHQGLNRNGSVLTVITFGGKPGVRKIGPHIVNSVGHLDDEGLRLYYSAADVMVVPSRMDNLPQTAVESIACGTPVVAFRTGGLPDIVVDGVTGKLAEPFSLDSLAGAIEWVLESTERHRMLSQSARASAVRWEPTRIAERYVSLFEEMMSR